MGFFSKPQTVLSSESQVTKVGQLFIDSNGNTCRATDVVRNSSNQVCYVYSEIVKFAAKRQAHALDYHNGITR